MGISKRKRSREPEFTYKRDGIYYARITVDGIEQRQSLKTRDREEAARRVTKWLEGRSPYKGTIRHTFREAAELWLDAGQWKRKTLEGYAKLLRIIDAHFGNFYWDQVDKPALLFFMAQRKEAGAGVATINRYLTVISGIADHVRELPGWPEVNPVRLLPVKSRKEKRLKFIRPPASDIDAMFARMHGTFRDVCTFALRTGARKDEIATLMRDDAQGGKAQLWETKHEFRVISLAPDVIELVERQPKHKCGYLFVTRNGGPYRRITEMWREVVARHKRWHRKRIAGSPVCASTICGTNMRSATWRTAGGSTPCNSFSGTRPSGRRRNICAI
jgi:integrase